MINQMMELVLPVTKKLSDVATRSSMSCLTLAFT